MADRPRKRRWPWILGVLGALALAAGWWIDRQLEPVRLATMVLARAGEATGLQLSFEGTPEYALRPEPRLVLEGFDARVPGAVAPMFRARRLEVSLPWDTLWGGPMVITRVQLDAPALDADALQAWLASRPPSEEAFELPTLSQGLSLREGRILGKDWQVEALSLAVPRLAPGEPASGEFSGEFRQAGLALVFAGTLDADHAGRDTGLRLVSAGRLRTEALDVPWSLQLSGRLDATREPLALSMASLAWRSQSPLPDAQAAGSLQWGETLALGLEGELPAWPTDWPALPAPLSEGRSAFGFSLRYDGPDDFSGPLHVLLRRDETTLESEFETPALLAWLDAGAASPLPPASARLSTPALVVEGVALEGIRVELVDDEAPAGEAEGEVP